MRIIYKHAITAEKFELDLFKDDLILCAKVENDTLAYMWVLQRIGVDIKLIKRKFFIAPSNLSIDEKIKIDRHIDTFLIKGVAFHLFEVK